MAILASIQRNFFEDNLFLEFIRLQIVYLMVRKMVLKAIIIHFSANIEGDGKARLKADEIALEIERNSASVARLKMENDDDERDLDKETPEFQVTSNRRSSNRYFLIFLLNTTCMDF